MRVQGFGMCKGLLLPVLCVLFTVFPHLWAEDPDQSPPIEFPPFPEFPPDFEFPGDSFPDLPGGAGGAGGEFGGGTDGGAGGAGGEFGGGTDGGGGGGPMFPDMGGMLPGAEMDLTYVNVTVRRGQTATLPCYVKHLGEHEVIWLNPQYTHVSANERIVVRHNQNKYRIDTTYQGQYNLVINSVQESRDQGLYTCMLQTFPPQTKEVNLNVEVPARIRQDSFKENLIVTENDLVDEVCVVRGSGWITVNWYKYDKTNVTRELYARGEQLTIPRIQRGQAGIYECETNNVLGNDTKQIRIDVMYPPTVRLSPDNIKSTLGEEVTFQCDVYAHPAAKVLWKRGKETIRSSWKYRVGNNFFNNETWVTTDLTITSTEVSDAGEYKCVAENTPGRKEESVVLSVTNPTTTTSSTTVALPGDLIKTDKPKTGSSVGGGATAIVTPPFLVLLPIVTILVTLS